MALQHFTVKWSGHEIEVSASADWTIADLKGALERKTGVLGKRQKLTGLPKHADDTRIADLKLKQPQRVMLIGSSEKDIGDVQASCMHVGMHACVHVCTHAYVRACVYLCMYACACVHTCKHACTCMHAIIYPGCLGPGASNTKSGLSYRGDTAGPRYSYSFTCRRPHYRGGRHDLARSSGKRHGHLTYGRYNIAAIFYNTSVTRSMLFFFRRRASSSTPSPAVPVQRSISGQNRSGHADGERRGLNRIGG